MFLRSARNVALAFTLAASAVPFAACSGQGNVSEPTATAQSNTTTAPLNVTVHGPAKRVADALATVPLRADQRATIEQMAKDAETRTEPVRKARADLAMAIADQVQAGAIDRTALQPKIDAVKSAHAAVEPQNRAALEKLHDLLTPDQRAAFVAAMENHPHEGFRHGMRERMQKWATDLSLTQDQQNQIRDQVRAKWQAKRAEGGPRMHEHMHAMLESFKGDKFTMDQPPAAGDFGGRMLGVLETAVPILTPAQRATAAQKLRDRAANFDEEPQK